MRRSLLVAILLGTTALSAPTKADAAPVFGFIAGALGVGAATFGATAAFAAGTAFAATTIGGFVVRAVVSIGLSVLSGFLAPSPSIPPPSARMVSYEQSINYIETVYGRTRKSGPIGFTGFRDNKRYYVPILAAHQIHRIVEHWLDERVVTLNAESAQSVSNIVETPISGYGRINPFLGGAAQTTDAGLDAAFPEITDSHNFAGLSGAAIWAARPPDTAFSDVYPNSREWVWAPVIEGCNQIYDPRDSSTGYSNNAALVLAHWIVNVLGQSVDWSEVAQEADVCDAILMNRDGQSQPKWTLNGAISDGDDYETQRAQMAAACDAFVYERTDGKVGFVVGRWIEPTIVLSPDDFYSLELVEGNWGADAPSEVTVQYTEPRNAWRESPTGTWVEDTTVRGVRKEAALYLINSHNQAVRVAKRIAKTKRAQYQISGTIGLKGYDLIGERFIRVVHPEMDVDEFFEIGELAREGVGQFSLVANSVVPSDFDFNAALEEPDRPIYSQVENEDFVAAVTGVGATSQDGASLDVSWDTQKDFYKQQLRFRLTEVNGVPSGSSFWQIRDVSAGDNQYSLTGLRDGGTYEIQIRNITAAGQEGAWSPQFAYEAVAVFNGVAPDAHTTFDATLNGTSVDIEFTAPNDPNYYATRIFRALNSTDFADASQIHIEYGIPSSADSYVDLAPGVGVFSYWLEPVNSSGISNPANRTGPENVSIT